MQKGSRKRKGSNLRQLQSGRWSVRYTDSQHRSREKSFPTKTEAERFLTKVKHDQASGDWIDPEAGNVALSSWAQDWLEARRSEVAPGTLRRYKGLLEVNVLPHLDGQVGSIRTIDVQQAVNDMSATLAPKTVQQALIVLRMVMASAVENRLRRDNPVDPVSPPKAPEEEMTFLLPEEVERICSARPKWAPLFRFFAYTGMRAGEVRGLKVADLEPLKNPMPVHIRRQTDRDGNDAETKGRKARTIYVAGQVEADLRERILGKRPSDRVWTSATGRWLHHSTPRETLQKAAREAGIERHVRLHDMRHTCASWLLDRGASIVRVSRWLGHKSVTETLDTYAHIVDEDLEECAELLWQPRREDGDESTQEAT